LPLGEILSRFVDASLCPEVARTVAPAFGLGTRLFSFPASCQSHESIISHNGPQVVARDFKEFTQIAETTPVRTWPYHPRSNGNWSAGWIVVERMHPAPQPSENDPVVVRARFPNHHVSAIRPGTARSQEDAERLPGSGIVKPCEKLIVILPDETETGPAGMQSWQGIARWAHRDDAGERGKSLFALVTKTHRIDPHALKIP
jgi:hypothetical protein